jgi:hypothetical protein
MWEHVGINTAYYRQYLTNALVSFRQNYEV